SPCRLPPPPAASRRDTAARLVERHVAMADRGGGARAVDLDGRVRRGILADRDAPATARHAAGGDEQLGVPARGDASLGQQLLRAGRGRLHSVGTASLRTPSGESTDGSAPSEVRPKHSRNSQVVPYSNGLPGA